MKAPFRCAASAALCLATPHLVYGADLMDVYRIAVDADPIFQSERAVFEVSKQKVPEALSALFPAIGASSTGGYTSGNTRYSGAPVGQRGFKSYSWNIQLTQPLLRVQSSANYVESLAVA